MKWSTTTIYVDIDTGEKLTTKQGKNFESYTVIKTTKHAKINYREGEGHITFTKQCRRNPQTKLDFSRETTDNR